MWKQKNIRNSILELLQGEKKRKLYAIKLLELLIDISRY